MSNYQLLTGDCRNVMAEMRAESVHSIVTDPPYGLSFMGKDWDHGIPGEIFWTEALRVAKPGAYLLAFGGTRTFHRLTVAIEDAGWEIRDVIMWVYGSGFPKSMDVSKAIDKAAGAERVVVELDRRYNEPNGIVNAGRGSDARTLVERKITAPATDAAKKWDGWGTALKPAWEPIIVARKPIEGTVANNVLTHDCGALNVAGCRVGVEVLVGQHAGQATLGTFERVGMFTPERIGRFPANLIHDGSDDVVRLFPVTDAISAARFFYCAKASKADRDEGLNHFPLLKTNDGGKRECDAPHQRGTSLRRNHHPTIKPTNLMRYLCRLVTPPGGTVLDPFMGSGSTGKAAILEGFEFTGIERDSEYIEIAQARIQHAVVMANEIVREKARQPVLFDV